MMMLRICGIEGGALFRDRLPISRFKAAEGNDLISRRNLLQLLSAGSLGVLGLGGYAFAEPHLAVSVTLYRLKPAVWPDTLKLRVGVISDLHACDPWMPADRIAAICDQMNGLGADVIVLLGDYVSEMFFVTRNLAPAEWARPLETLRAPLGVHAVLGNHDWWDDPAAQANDGTFPVARRALEAVGIPVHSNRAIRLQKDGRPFWLAGLESQMALIRGSSDWRKATGKDDLDQTLGQTADDEPVILLAHEPDIFPRVPERVSLTLSGHTHGGQVRLFGRAPIVPSRFGDHYAYGHVQEGGRNIIISGGLGCSMLPIRFLCRPEINLIELG